VPSADVHAPRSAPPPAPAQPHDAAAAGRLNDAHGRVIRDVRLSITDRCNYRCIYCMEPDHRYMPRMSLLSANEYARVARILRGFGIDRLRVTGGEPTLYRELDPLIDALGGMGFADMSMTTNGSLVTAERAVRWRAGGLNRLTFSLDTLRADRFLSITRARSGHPDDLQRAIMVARAAGLDPIKINAVIMRGINDDECADFADFARTHDVDVRFIEWMPLDSGGRWDRRVVVPASEIRQRIEGRHPLVPARQRDKSETARNFRFADGAPGRIGLIAPVTQNFCGACSRLRITADGKIRPCLFSHQEWDLRPLLRSGATDDELRAFIVDAVWQKQAGHGIDAADFRPPERGMSAIGG